MAGFGRKRAVAAVSYALARRYDLLKLFPIVLPGLRGRYLPEA